MNWGDVGTGKTLSRREWLAEYIRNKSRMPDCGILDKDDAKACLSHLREHKKLCYRMKYGHIEWSGTPGVGKVWQRAADVLEEHGIYV